MSETTAHRPRFHATDRDEWRGWLSDHHRDSSGVWLVSWKRHTGRPAVSYDDAVTEALAFGWVDSRPSALDADRTMLYFSPRQRGSGWSRPNKQRISRLEEAGLLQPAGRQQVDQAKADGTWTMLDAVEDLLVPPDLAAALDAVPGSREHWEAFPRSAKRGILEWIVQAKRPDTRLRRVTETAELAGRGERANQWSRKAPPAGSGPT